MNIVIPAAGLGSRFNKMGWKRPKPFIDLNNSPMIEHVLKYLDYEDADYNIIFRKEHIDEYNDVIEALKNDKVKISQISNITEGTACTVLSLYDVINTEQPLVIANSDQIVDFKFQDFILDAQVRKLDGSILVFESSDPKWSFAKLDNSGFVTEVAEKKPISDLATVGIYYFSSGKAFVRAAIEMIVANERVNGEFYTCPVYNYMIRNGAKIGVYTIHSSQMNGVGTPVDLIKYLKKNKFPKSTDMPTR